MFTFFVSVQKNASQRLIFLFLGGFCCTSSLLGEAATAAKIVLSENCLVNEQGTQLGTGESTQGDLVFNWSFTRPLAKGLFLIKGFALGKNATDYVIETSADGFNFEYVQGGATPVTDRIQFPLPKGLVGCKEIYLRVRATRSTAETPAATFQEVSFQGIESDTEPAKNVLPWRVSQVNPWIEADGSSLPAQATALETTHGARWIGPTNDWLTGAFLIFTPKPVQFEVALETPEALTGKMEMRVVGLVRGMGSTESWDPLYSAGEIANAKDTFNYSYIRNFPQLQADRPMPAYLWFTVDLRDVEPGEYPAKLKITDANGAIEEISIQIVVLKEELPKTSPLYLITWNGWKEEEMEDMIDHGVNVAFRNHEAAWKKGATFLLFQLLPTFGPGPFDSSPAKRQEIGHALDEIHALVNKLKVPKDQWAVNLQDEVNDSSAETVGKYGKVVKELRPDTPIWQNPLYGGSADATMQGHSATIEGTIRKIQATTDYYCPYSWHVGTPLWDALKATGKPLWFYEIWGSAGRNAQVGRQAWRMLPYQAWHYGAQGIGNYNLNEWLGDLYRGPVTSYSVVYPGNGRVISSRGYEALRQGIQEYKLLLLLKDKGVSKQLLDTWVGLALGASSADVIQNVRASMLSTLVQLDQQKENR